MKKLLLSLLFCALAAQAGRMTPMEFYPGIAGFVSSPDFTVEISKEGDFTAVIVSNPNSGGAVVITTFDTTEYLDLVFSSELKSVSSKVKSTCHLHKLVVGSSQAVVKMKNFYMGTLEAYGLKTAQIKGAQSIIQSGNGYSKGAVVKVGDFVGRGSHTGEGYLGGCFKSITAERFFSVKGEGTCCGSYWIGNSLTTPKKLVLSARECTEFSVIVPEGVPCKAKKVNVTGPRRGDYLRIDLEYGAVDYFKEPPETWGPEDKTLYMWFRRIPAGNFVMGSPKDEPGRKIDEDEHLVTISKEFWAAVFELTEGQMRTMGYTSYAGSLELPYSGLSYEQLRGDDEGARFPASDGVDRLSILGVLRYRTPGYVFDLPTEAQWEYACKAGTHASWNDGSTILETDADDAHLDELGWYKYNSGLTLHEVGTLKPNAWGLYDTHGNVRELCLDWYGEYDPVKDTDPVGVLTGEERVIRGGAAGQSPCFVRPAFRDRIDPGLKSGSAVGARLFIKSTPLD